MTISNFFLFVGLLYLTTYPNLSSGLVLDDRPYHPAAKQNSCLDRSGCSAPLGGRGG